MIKTDQPHIKNTEIKEDDTAALAVQQGYGSNTDRVQFSIMVKDDDGVMRTKAHVNVTTEHAHDIVDSILAIIKKIEGEH